MGRANLIFRLSAAAILFLVFLLGFIFQGVQAASLRRNATCKHNNSTGICKSRDSCLTNLTGVALEPCDEDDLSVICCPFEGKALPPIVIQAGIKINSNRPKRAPGEKAKEMCKIYQRIANGRHEKQPLIGGGNDAKKGEFTHMVAIGNFEPEVNNGSLNWLCSGSLVSPKFILSAAHCNVTKENGFAAVGTIVIPEETTDKFFEDHVIGITSVFIHPDYKANDNDIALFELQIKVKISNLIKPICLDTGTPLIPGMPVIATGFGLNEEGKRMQFLQKVTLKIVDKDLCAAKYQQISKPIDLPEYSFCAYSKRKDTCKGDSGGPIQIRNDHTCMYTIIGIISFGDNCSREEGLPGVYTKVSPYIGWIEDIVWPDFKMVISVSM